MAEILEDFADNTKSLFKNKKFLVAAGVVAVAALFVGYRRNKAAQAAQEQASQAGSPAVAYAGYPSAETDNSQSTLGYYEALLSEMQSDYDSKLSDMQGEYSANIADLTSKHDADIADLTSKHDADVADLMEQLDEMANKDVDDVPSHSRRRKNDSYQEELEKMQDLAQMKANSELYNALTSPENEAERKSLHAINLAIAEKYGWKYNGNTGNYYDSSGNVLYTTADQQARMVNVVSGKTSTSSGETFVNNKQYQASYAQSVQNGGGKTVQVAKGGNAPEGTQIGDTVKTAGGSYKVVAPNTAGASYNPSNGLWSVKID